MSSNEAIKILRKKITSNINVPDNTIKNNHIYHNHNKIINSNNLYKIDNEDDLMCEYSNELLNENIKLSNIISPFINPVPCFTVKNEHSEKEIANRGTFCKNLKTQINFPTGKKNENNMTNNEKNNDKSLKTKILNNKTKKSLISHKFIRPHSPNLERKENKILVSENLEITAKKDENINYEFFLDNKRAFNNNINKLNNTKPILSSNKKHKIRNQLFYSTDNCYEPLNIYKENKIREMEENKNKKLRYIKLLGQKINVATMKIEILENYKKNKNLNSIRKKIEYNKIYCNNDLKRLKENYYKNIKQHQKQIQYLKTKLLKCEEKFIPNNKHKEEINKEKLLFQIQKMDLIEKIILLRKKMKDFLNPDSTTNETYTYGVDDSFEEQTINDISLNDFSFLKDTIGVGVNFSYNFNKKSFSKEESLFESKIIKMKPNEANLFNVKLIKNINDKKSKIKKNLFI